MLEMSMTRVGDILRLKDTRIITVRLRETAGMAVTLMKREDVSALVVKDVCRTEGHVVGGGFSEREAARAAAHGAAVRDMRVSAFLNRPLVSCVADDSIDAVLQLMDEHQVRLLPVLQNQTLIGVISIGDFIRHLVQTPALGSRVDAVRAGLPVSRHAGQHN